MHLFNPFGDTPNHEDRLTWSFLTMLKYDLCLQKFLYDAVTTNLTRLPANYDAGEPAHISTQTSKISESTRQLVSVLLTDEKIHKNIEIKWSERNARYDGVVEYANGLTLIIENKHYHESVSEEQLSPSLNSVPNGCRDSILLHEFAQILTWPDVLEAVLQHSYSEVASFGDRAIACDFLSFAGHYQPNLTPYRTYLLCGNRESALVRRTESLVDAIASKTELSTHSKNRIVRQSKIAVYIIFEIIMDSNKNSWKLRIALYPASTSAQANRFRETLNRADFLNLKEQHWIVEPNLNFSFIGSKIHWATSDCDSESYLSYFFDHKERYGRRYPNQLEDLLEQWSKNGLIRCEDASEIRRIPQSKMFLDINPEFAVYRELDSDYLIELDRQGQLETQILESLSVPLATWGEDIRVLR